MTTSPKFSRPRFPLFSKIVAGFAFIIVFMISCGMFLLYELIGVFSLGELESKSIKISQDLQQLYKFESKAAAEFINTKDSSKVREFLRLNRSIQTMGGSLLHMVDQADSRVLIESLLVSHNGYTEFFSQARSKMQRLSSEELSFVDEEHKLLREQVTLKLQKVTESLRASMLVTMSSFFKEATKITDNGKVVFSLAFVVAFASAILIARTITRPIKALKTGTEKVGEGKYETVAITTTDEVADLTRAFNMMSDKLRQLDEMRMEMMSEISHEMRTPLQVIKAGCYSIIHTKDGPVLTQRQRDAVAMIHQASNRINAFVNSFLDVAKMEAGLMKFNFEQISIVELVTPLVQEAQLIAQTRQITLEFLAGEIPVLSIDKERMGQVFSNLLSNALKYTPDSGKITFRLSNIAHCLDVGKNGKGCVRIEVQDTGVGIPESDLAKLFDKFYQAKNVPLVNEKGSGLGLALVKHVSEAHGGKVSVKSKVGEGSTFIVELPIV